MTGNETEKIPKCKVTHCCGVRSVPALFLSKTICQIRTDRLCMLTKGQRKAFARCIGHVKGAHSRSTSALTEATTSSVQDVSEW
uniref:Uncharacterized protein n=1 Tax=Trichuris muris TaxID=70415 RepID=A0A5S6QTS5_TRIMR